MTLNGINNFSNFDLLQKLRKFGINNEEEVKEILSHVAGGLTELQELAQNLEKSVGGSELSKEEFVAKLKEYTEQKKVYMDSLNMYLTTLSQRNQQKKNLSTTETTNVAQTTNAIDTTNTVEAINVSETTDNSETISTTETTNVTETANVSETTNIAGTASIIDNTDVIDETTETKETEEIEETSETEESQENKNETQTITNNTEIQNYIKTLSPTLQSKINAEIGDLSEIKSMEISPTGNFTIKTDSIELTKNAAGSFSVQEIQQCEQPEIKDTYNQEEIPTLDNIFMQIPDVEIGNTETTVTDTTNTDTSTETTDVATEETTTTETPTTEDTTNTFVETETTDSESNFFLDSSITSSGTDTNIQGSGSLQNQLNALEQEKEATESDLQQEETNLETTQTEKDSSLGAIDSEIQTEETNLDGANTEVETSEVEVNEATEEVETADEQVQESQDTVDTSKSELDTATEEVNEATETKDTAAEDVETKAAEEADAQEDSNQANDDVSTATQNTNEAQNTSNQKQEEYNTASAESVQAFNVLNQANSEVASAQAEYNSAQAQASSDIENAWNKFKNWVASALNKLHAAFNKQEAAAAEAERKEAAEERAKVASDEAIDELNTRKEEQAEAEEIAVAAKVVLDQKTGARKVSEQEYADALIVLASAMDTRENVEGEYNSALQTLMEANNYKVDAQGQLTDAQGNLVSAQEVVTGIENIIQGLSQERKQEETTYNGILENIAGAINDDQDKIKQLNTEIENVQKAIVEEEKRIAMQEMMLAQLANEKSEYNADEATDGIWDDTVEAFGCGSAKEEENIQNKQAALEKALLSGSEEDILAAYKAIYGDKEIIIDENNNIVDPSTLTQEQILAYEKSGQIKKISELESNQNEILKQDMEAEAVKAVEAQNTAEYLNYGYFTFNGEKLSQDNVVDILLKQTEDLLSDTENAIDDQGWLSKTISGLNSQLGFGTTSMDARSQAEMVQKQIEELKNCKNPSEFAAKFKAITGQDFNESTMTMMLASEQLSKPKDEQKVKTTESEYTIDLGTGVNEILDNLPADQEFTSRDLSVLTETKAAETMEDYKETQAVAKDVTVGIAVGVVTTVAVIAAPVTGGASLALGAAVGGATKVLLEGTDTIGTSQKYSWEEGILDFLSGGIDGAITALTLGGVKLAGQGFKTLFTSTAKAGVKQTTKLTTKALVKETLKQGAKASVNAMASTTAHYLTDTVVTNALYEHTGNAERSGQGIQNSDGTTTYSVVDKNTGKTIYYETVSIDENGNEVVERSNDFNLKDFAINNATSALAAFTGAGIGKFTGNVVNPKITNLTNSKVLGNVFEIATDATLSLTADFGIEWTKCKLKGEEFKVEEFLTWERILGEGQNQIRGLFIGIASSKVNDMEAAAYTAAASKMSSGADYDTVKKVLIDGGVSTKNATQFVANDAAQKLLTSGCDVDSAIKTMTDMGFDKTDATLTVTKMQANIDAKTNLTTIGAEETTNMLIEAGYSKLEAKNMVKEMSVSEATYSIISGDTDGATKILEDAGFSKKETQAVFDNVKTTQEEAQILTKKAIQNGADIKTTKQLLAQQGLDSYISDAQIAGIADNVKTEDTARTALANGDEPDSVVKSMTDMGIDEATARDTVTKIDAEIDAQKGLVAIGASEVQKNLIEAGYTEAEADSLIKEISVSEAQNLTLEGDIDGATDILRDAGYSKKDANSIVKEISVSEATKAIVKGDTDSATKLLSDAGYKEEEIQTVFKNVNKAQETARDAAKKAIQNGADTEKTIEILAKQGLDAYIDKEEISKIADGVQKENDAIYFIIKGDTNSATKLLSDAGYSKKEIQTLFDNVRIAQEKAQDTAKKAIQNGADTETTKQLLAQQGLDSYINDTVIGIIAEDVQTENDATYLIIKGDTDGATKLLTDAKFTKKEIQAVFDNAKITQENARDIARKAIQNGSDISATKELLAQQGLDAYISDTEIAKIADNIVYTIDYKLNVSQYTESTLDKIHELENAGLLNRIDTITAIAPTAEINQALKADIDRMYAAYRQGIDIKDVYVPTVKDIEEATISLNVGDLCTIQGSHYMSIKLADGTIQELNITADKYMELFPPGERFAFKQQNIGDCYLVASLYAMEANPVARATLLSCFYEGVDGNIMIQIPNSEILQMNTAKFINDREIYGKTVAGPDGIKMLEYAYGKTLQYNKYKWSNNIRTDLIYMRAEKENIGNLCKYLSDKKDITFEELEAKANEFGLSDITKQEELFSEILTKTNYGYKIKESKISAKLTEIENTITELNRKIETLTKEINDLVANPHAEQDIRGQGGYMSDVFKMFGLDSEISYFPSVTDDFYTLLQDSNNWDQYIFGLGSKGTSDTKFLNKDIYLAGRHAYNVVPFYNETGEVVYKVTNPWNTTAANILTFDQLKEYFNNFYYAKIG